MTKKIIPLVIGLGLAFGHGRLGLGRLDAFAFTATGQCQHRNCHRYFTHCPAPLRIKRQLYHSLSILAVINVGLNNANDVSQTCMMPPWELMSPLCVLKEAVTGTRLAVSYTHTTPALSETCVLKSNQGEVHAYTHPQSR